MNPDLKQATDDHVAEDADDPFRYGWRYQRQICPDNSETIVEMPLSWEDLLYPEEDDFVVQKPPHLRDFEYVHGTMETHYASQDEVVVLGDCRVDWGVEGLRPLGPDVIVLFGVREWLQAGTFRVAEEGGRPILVVEIASPSTRGHDLRNKPELYYRAGVQKYVIIDRGPQGEDPVRLLVYQCGPVGWLPLPLHEQGRLNLAPVPLLLGIEDGRPWLYDAVTGERLPDRTELWEALANSKNQVRDEARGRLEAEEKASDEARGRLEAEAKAQAEVRGRIKAETKASDEASLRSALELRVRELEEQIRRQQGQ